MAIAGTVFAGIMASPAGGLIARPWFDRVALRAMIAWHFPASRVWAAAEAADGDFDRFLSDIGITTPSRSLASFLRSGFDRVTHASQNAAHWLAQWEDGFFGNAKREGDLNELEARRRKATHELIVSRQAFFRSGLLKQVPKLRLSVPSPDEALPQYMAHCETPAEFYQLPPSWPVIDRSHDIVTRRGREYWLRFASPDAGMGDKVWAHVFEPVAATSIPTLIHGHGVGVETEFLDGIVDGHTKLPKQNVRLIRFEAPFHCRRRKKGFYGSEPFFSGLPISGLQSLSAEAKEFAVLTAWAREQVDSANVGIGGTSMGALASQLAASQAMAWPKSARPDALLLLTTCDDVASLGLHCSLTDALGIADAMRKAGWSDHVLAPYQTLANAAQMAPLPPDQIVMLLGSHDTVTPFEQGLRLARRWRVPPDNLFIRRQGHFSASVGLLHDRGPLNRFADILHR